jgi:hypothetical protein
MHPERTAMGFLKKVVPPSSTENVLPANRQWGFDRLTDEELQTHMGISRYGVFELTDAVRPSYDLQVVPKQGFRRDEYRDEESGARIPVLMGAASAPYLLDLFFDLIDALGPVVDVVLESSHGRGGGHQDLYREHIDLPVLKSTLWDFEDLLLNDGCTGIAVVNPAKRQEIQFDEHKLLVVYGSPSHDFEQIFIRRDVYPEKGIRFITEAEHVHSSSEDYCRQFDQLKLRLGVED